MEDVDKIFIDEVAKTYLVRKKQTDKVDKALNNIHEGLDALNEKNRNNNDELDKLLSEAMKLCNGNEISLNELSKEDQEKAENMIALNSDDLRKIEIPYYEMIETIDVGADWKQYFNNVQHYAENNDIDLSKNPFDELLTEQEKNEIGQMIRDDYLLEKANCDKYDYMIAAFCGAVCAIIDSFFVKMPSSIKEDNSALGKWTDKQADNFIEHLSKGLWNKDSKKRDEIINMFKEHKITREQRDNLLKEAGIPYNQNIEKAPISLQQCIQYLEKKFGVNYDASSAAYLESDGKLKGMRPLNHHIMSLGHLPSIIGMIFSILDQFTGKASFIDNGKLIRLVPIENKNSIDMFELRGNNFATKLICGFSNWLGHLCSDLVGSNTTRKEGSTGRGTGLPLPLTEVLQLCSFKVPDGNGDKMTISDLTIKVFENGYDVRFAAATAIPVVLNEFLIRLFWSLKSRFYHKRTWKESIPFGKHPELRRMLLVGHGVLCTIDLADAAIRSVDMITFIMHLNVAAWTRITISGLQEVRALYKQNVIDIDVLDDDLEIEWRRLYNQMI